MVNWFTYKLRHARQASLFKTSVKRQLSKLVIIFLLKSFQPRLMKVWFMLHFVLLRFVLLRFVIFITLCYFIARYDETKLQPGEKRV